MSHAAEHSHVTAAPLVSPTRSHSPIPREVGRALAEQLGYAPALLARAPELAVTSFAGVGHHMAMADLRPGEQVADLAAGAGLDSFIAALQVGRTGRVHAFEESSALRHKIAALRDDAGLSHMEVSGGPLASMAPTSASLDCVIGNDATARVADPALLFAEAARVLRPGGRLVLSDLVSARLLPRWIRADEYARAAGLAGVMHRRDYQETLTAAGFTIAFVQLNPYRYRSEPLRRLADEYGIRSISLVATRR